MQAQAAGEFQPGFPQRRVLRRQYPLKGLARLDAKIVGRSDGGSQKRRIVLLEPGPDQPGTFGRLQGLHCGRGGAQAAVAGQHGLFQFVGPRAVAEQPQGTAAVDVAAVPGGGHCQQALLLSGKITQDATEMGCDLLIESVKPSSLDDPAAFEPAPRLVEECRLARVLGGDIGKIQKPGRVS